MSKYAIIRLGGKQFKIIENYEFELERQAKLDIEVLLYSDGKEVLIGEPVLKSVKVDAEIIEEKKGDKIRVARFKSKSRYRKVKGHRQPLSVVKIKKITKGAAKATAEKKPAKKAPAKKKVVKKGEKK